jgi:hypothetical protein
VLNLHHSKVSLFFILQLHKAVGAAVAAMGPDQLLVLLPLELDGADLLKSRVWLLPILKQHTVGARLQFFSSTLLPLAARLRERARKVSFSLLAELYHFKVQPITRFSVLSCVLFSYPGLI